MDPISRGLAAISPEWAKKRKQFGAEGFGEEPDQSPQYSGKGEDGVLRGLAAKTQQPYRPGWAALPGVASSIIGGFAARKLRTNEQHKMQGERAAWGGMTGPNPDFGAAMERAPMGSDVWKYARNKVMAANDPDAQLDRQIKEARLTNMQRQPERQRRIVKGADGRNYYTDTSEPVLPNVQPQSSNDQRKMVKAADGRYHYADDGALAFPDIQAASPQQGHFKNFGDQVKFEQSLRKEHSNLAKTFRDVRDAYGRLSASYKPGQNGVVDYNIGTGASDISAVFNYMKMLDPGSVVREGEFATAQNSGGVPAKIASLYNNVINGQSLTATLRKNFHDQAKSLYEKSHSQYSAMTGRFGQLLQERGIESGQVLMDHNPVEGPTQQPRRPAASAIASPDEISSLDTASPEQETARLQQWLGGEQGAAATLPTVGSPQEAMQLPPGTRFRTPDGRIKIR